MQSEDKKRLERLASKLRGKQRAFADSYMSNGENGTKASKEAGYKGNHKTLGVVAVENLAKPSIKAYIDAFKEIDAKKYQITRESLLADIQIAKDYALDTIKGSKAVSEGERLPVAQYQPYLESIKLQAKMLGLNEPDKLDLTTGGERMATIDMSSLSEQALQEIANAPQSSD